MCPGAFSPTRFVCESNLDFAARVETVQLVQQFQHRTLDLLLTTARGIVTLRSNGVDFILHKNEHANHRIMRKRPTQKVFARVLRFACPLTMKTMDGAFSSATRNSSRTSFGPSPKYFWINSEPTTRKKVALVSLATAFANRVLPVPGAKNNAPAQKKEDRNMSFNRAWPSHAEHTRINMQASTDVRRRSHPSEAVRKERRREAQTIPKRSTSAVASCGSSKQADCDRRNPRTLMPISSYISGCVIGSSTASLTEEREKQTHKSTNNRR